MGRRGFAAMMYTVTDTFLSHCNACPHYLPEIFPRIHRLLSAAKLSPNETFVVASPPLWIFEVQLQIDEQHQILNKLQEVRYYWNKLRKSNVRTVCKIPSAAWSANCALNSLQLRHRRLSCRMQVLSVVCDVLWNLYSIVTITNRAVPFMHVSKMLH